MDSKQKHHTKKGPGRRHVQGDGKKTAKQRAAGAYGRGLKNHFDAKAAAASAERRARRVVA